MFTQTHTAYTVQRDNDTHRMGTKERIKKKTTKNEAKCDNDMRRCGTVHIRF